VERNALVHFVEVAADDRSRLARASLSYRSRCRAHRRAVEVLRVAPGDARQRGESAGAIPVVGEVAAGKKSPVKGIVHRGWRGNTVLWTQVPPISLYG
jgi:hypothetical protein